jgi:hypothetical protein
MRWASRAISIRCRNMAVPARGPSSIPLRTKATCRGRAGETVGNRPQPGLLPRPRSPRRSSGPIRRSGRPRRQAGRPRAIPRQKRPAPKVGTGFRRRARTPRRRRGRRTRPSWPPRRRWPGRRLRGRSGRPWLNRARTAPGRAAFGPPLRLVTGRCRRLRQGTMPDLDGSCRSIRRAPRSAKSPAHRSPGDTCRKAHRRRAGDRRGRRNSGVAKLPPPSRTRRMSKGGCGPFRRKARCRPAGRRSAGRGVARDRSAIQVRRTRRVGRRSGHAGARRSRSAGRRGGSKQAPLIPGEPRHPAMTASFPQKIVPARNRTRSWRRRICSRTEAQRRVRRTPPAKACATMARPGTRRHCRRPPRRRTRKPLPSRPLFSSRFRRRPDNRSQSSARRIRSRAGWGRRLKPRCRSRRRASRTGRAAWTFRQEAAGGRR